jgi:uncharacterized YccA/Bax inhibitor family protein
MNETAIFLAAFGLGSASYAALEPEIGELVQRAVFGSFGLLLVTLGIYSI